MTKHFLVSIKNYFLANIIHKGKNNVYQICPFLPNVAYY